MLVVPKIFRVFVLREFDATLFTKFIVSLKKTSSSVGYHWVTETRDVDLVPGLAEHNITLDKLIFKSSSESPIRSTLLNRLLDRASYTTRSPNLSTYEFGNFQAGVEHTLDKRSIFHDLIWLTDQLKFLHNLELGVEFDNYSGNTEPEMRHVFLVSFVICFV